MELEGYSRPTCDKLCASSNYVSIVVGVIHKVDRRRVLLTAPSISRDEIFFLSLEFGGKVPDGSTLTFEDTRISLQHSMG